MFAIIALLIAMLLPSLQRARAQTKTMRCMNNCKEIGLAVELYGQNNFGRFPLSGGHGGVADPQTWWFNVLARADVNTSLLYRCPTDPAENFVDWEKVDWEGVDDEFLTKLQEKRWGSYALNYLMAKEPNPYCHRLSRIKKPTHTIFIAEAADTLAGVDHVHPERFLLMPPERQVAIERHLGKACYLFVDGHVDTLTLADTWEPGKRNLWDPKTRPPGVMI